MKRTVVRFDRMALGALIVGALRGMVALADRISPQDPIRQDLSFSFFSPNEFHPFGTDGLGRDVLARVIHGARVSLPVAVFATLLATLIGTAFGLASAAIGGRADHMLMRLVDLALAFPTLVLLLVLASLYRTDHPIHLILLLGLTAWMPMARLVRAESLSLSRQPFLEAAEGLGATSLRRALRHMLPNVASTILVTATLLVGELMLMESGLSYLGLGVAPPTPSWGDMVRQGMPNLHDCWWVATFPGLFLAVAVIAFNLLGDGLRDAIDPRLSLGQQAPSPETGRTTSS